MQGDVHTDQVINEAAAVDQTVDNSFEVNMNSVQNVPAVDIIHVENNNKGSTIYHIR